jgi:hypothetical protein
MSPPADRYHSPPISSIAKQKFSASAAVLGICRKEGSSRSTRCDHQLRTTQLSRYNLRSIYPICPSCSSGNTSLIPIGVYLFNSGRLNVVSNRLASDHCSTSGTLTLNRLVFGWCLLLIVNSLEEIKQPESSGLFLMEFLIDFHHACALPLVNHIWIS